MRSIDYLEHKFIKASREKDIKLLYSMNRFNTKRIAELKVVSVAFGTSSFQIDLRKFMDLKKLIRFLFKKTESLKESLDKRVCVNKFDEDGDTLLHVACVIGNIETVKIVLDKGLQIGVFNKEGYTAFHMAAMYGREDIVNFLLNQGVDVNIQSKKRKETALHLACLYGNKAVVKILLNRKAGISLYNKDKNDALHLAVINGNKGIVKLLLDNKININSVNKDKETALHLACRDGKIGIVKILLEEGANVDALNKDNCTPLYVACANGNKKVVELLLEEANVDIENKVGHTPMHLVCCRGDIDILKQLLAEGADMEKTDKEGDAALHIACFNNNEKVVSLLIEEGVNVNTVNKKGETPLHIACCRGNINIVRSLLKGGGDINAVNKKGDRPLVLAYDMGDKKIVQELLKREDIELVIEETVKNLCDSLKNDEFTRIGKYNGMLKVIMELSGAPVELLNKKLIDQLKDICVLGNKKSVNILLDKIEYISDEELLKFINISKLCMIDNFLNRFGIVRISQVFSKIDAKRREYILEYVCNKKNLLNKVSGKLKEELNLKISKNLHKKTGVVSKFDVIKKDVLRDDVLLRAIKSGDKRIIKKLLYKDIDLNFVDSRGKNALMYAIDAGYTNIIDILLDKGICVNVADKSGKTALMYAIEKGDIEVTRMLIDRGAEFNIRDNNNKSVFMYALEKGASMSFVIDNMINISSTNDRDLKCSTVLMYACAGGYMKAVKQLIEGGADINAVNVEGDAPLSMAFNNNNISIVEYLIKLKVIKQGNIRRKDDFNKLKKIMKENKKEQEDIKSQEIFFQNKDNREKKSVFEVGIVDVDIMKKSNKEINRNSRTNLRRR